MIFSFSLLLSKASKFHCAFVKEIDVTRTCSKPKVESESNPIHVPIDEAMIDDQSREEQITKQSRNREQSRKMARLLPWAENLTLTTTAVVKRTTI